MLYLYYGTYLLHASYYSRYVYIYKCNFTTITYDITAYIPKLCRVVGHHCMTLCLEQLEYFLQMVMAEVRNIL